MKFLKWLALIVVAVPVLLVGGMYIRNVTVGAEGWAKDDAAKALKEKMKDPDSMVIRSEYIVKSIAPTGDEQIAVCGIVDGKNGFGAFTGGLRFVAISYHDTKAKTFKTYSVEMDNTSIADRATAKQVKQLTAFEEVYWNKNCVDDTHPALVFEG